MRVIIASPPRTGNNWLKCLLSDIYNLEILSGVPGTVLELEEKNNVGWFTENSIFHQHFEPTQIFLDFVKSQKLHIVTILRNPYDEFVSLYFFVQNFPNKFDASHHLYILKNKPIEHPDVITFLEDMDLGFRVYLDLANAWLKSNRSKIVYYESLKEKPLRELVRLTKALQPVEPDDLKSAIRNCNLRNMRRGRLVRAKHIRKGQVGDFKQHLMDIHFDIFASLHADVINGLGYEVV